MRREIARAFEIAPPESAAKDLAGQAAEKDQDETVRVSLLGALGLNPAGNGSGRQRVVFCTTLSKRYDPVWVFAARGAGRTCREML